MFLDCEQADKGKIKKHKINTLINSCLILALIFTPPDFRIGKAVNDRILSTKNLSPNERRKIRIFTSFEFHFMYHIKISQRRLFEKDTVFLK